MRKKMTLWALLAAVMSMAGPAFAQPASEEPMMELPLLTWQQQFELTSTVQQVLMNTYLPFLARPTDFRGVHNDAVPNQVQDWNWQRDDVRAQLSGRQDDVDAKRRSHAALPDAEVNAIIGKKLAFRPEDLEKVLVGIPRFQDIIVSVRRVQPLGPTSAGGETYRIDFDVKTVAGGVTETTAFDRIDVISNLGTWLMPTRVVLDVAPIARATANIADGAAGDDLFSLARAGIAVVLNTVRDISPIDISQTPILEQ